MQWWVKHIAGVFIIFIYCHSQAQVASDSIPPHRLRNTIIGESITYSATVSSLYFVWYADQDLVPMHSFNDFDEWMQMDKIGHLSTAFLFSEYSNDLYHRAGLKNNSAACWSAGQSLFFLSTLEVMDGFSSGWGFSWSDMGANVLGCGLFLSQQLGWEEQRIRMKFSSHPTSYSQYRPHLLGSDFASRTLKDYNGQTYWLSLNIASFLKSESRFPQWINLAFGYGAEGMIGGRENPAYDANGNPYPVFQRYRQYYLSFDIDFRKIPVKRKWQRVMLNSLNWIKIPFPALEFSEGGISFRPFYF